MVLLAGTFSVGALMLAAALVLWPYRIKFLRRVDRLAFLLSTAVSGLLGAALAGGAGAFLMSAFFAA